jgi:hypothetical protein
MGNVKQNFNNMGVAKQQREVVLGHIGREGSITSFEAIQLYNITRLAARVHDLRKLGHIIETQKIDVEGGHAFARYVMGRAA